MNKYSLILFLYFVILTSSYSVSGISSKKLIIPSAEVLEPKKYEVDFNFYWLKTENYYSEQRKLRSFELKCTQESCRKNKIYEGGISFRFTTGLGYQSEIGFEAGQHTTQEEVQDFTFSYIEDLKIGYKKNFFNKDFLISFQLGNSYDYKTFTPLYESGILISKEWNHFSFDFDFHYFTTKRILIFEEEKFEQKSWYYGPHFGIGISYSFQNLLFSIEYHFEEGKTKIREYQFKIKELNIDSNLFAQITNLENLSWNTLLNLPKTIPLGNIEIPVDKIYKNSKYFLIAQTMYYGISYSFSNNASLSIVIHDIINGSNVFNNLVLNFIVTFTSL